MLSVWYNGLSFGGTHIKDSLNKKAFLNQDYIEALNNNNHFIINRLKKYSKGFKITIQQYEFKIKIMKKILKI